jgi:hypothetical protein
MMMQPNINCYCCTTDPKLFSDEAFLLLVLINGGARWMSEIKQENGKVCILPDRANSINCFLTLLYNAHRRAGTHNAHK